MSSVESYWLAVRNARTEATPTWHDYITEWPTIRLLIVKICYAIGYVTETAGSLARIENIRSYGAKFKYGDNFVVNYLIGGKPLVLELDKNGKIVSALQGSLNNRSLRDITEVVEVSSSDTPRSNEVEKQFDNSRTLLIGSDKNEFVAKVTFKVEGQVMMRMRTDVMQSN